MKIEVAHRFEKSNWLYQKEAFTPLLVQGVWGCAPLENLKISMPYNAISTNCQIHTLLLSSYTCGLIFIVAYYIIISVAI